MSFEPRRIERIRTAFDEGEALALLRRAIAVPSVTGEEKAFAELLARELKALGASDVTVKDFAPGRPNVSARLCGDGGGPRLLLTGHTDTVHVRGWAERWRGTERADPFGGAVVDGEIWGRGSGDLKAGICATLMAARVVRQAGLSLPREILFAFIGDEESGEPDSGVSAGMKAFAQDVLSGAFARPDVAIYVEPTRLNVYAAQMGFLICDVSVTGKSAYFGLPEFGVDALKAGHAVLSALWAHSAALERLAPHPLVGRPFLLVTEVKAGGYIAVPGECRISLILKLIPGPEPRRGEGRARSRRAFGAARAGNPARLRLSRRPRPSGRRHTDGNAGGDAFRPAARRRGAQRASRPGRDRRRALLVRGAVPRHRARRSDGLLGAGRHPKLPHARGARRTQRIFRRRRRPRGVPGRLRRRRKFND